MASSREYELIGTEVSLYTGKVRAYLRFKGIPFRETLSTAEVYREKIIPRTGVRFIPVVITDDDVAIQDTTEIIDAIELRYPEPCVVPPTPRQRMAALLLELYGDEWLVLPAMHYRWSYEENRRFAQLEFGRTSAPERSPEEQQAIGEKLSAPFAGALPRLGIQEETRDAIEASYLGFLSEFERHLVEYPFLLGTRPSIGDFGLVGPLYAHLQRDPYSGRLLRKHAPRVDDWVTRMLRPSGQPGAFLPEDRVPESAMPILRRMFSEQVPVLLETVRALELWAAGHPSAPIPRSVGRVAFQVNGVSGVCAADPYRQWMWQRVVDLLQGADPSERRALESWLAEIPGALDALQAPIAHRVERRSNRLAFVSDATSWGSADASPV